MTSLPKSADVAVNLFASVMVFASSALSQSLTERDIHPNGKGPQQLSVDAALIAASTDGSLKDLRLRDASGKEIPYLLISPEVTSGSWQPARILPIPEAVKTSGFELDLGQVTTSGRLRVAGLKEPFLKRCKVEGSGDRRRWTELGDQGLLFSLPDENLSRLELPFQEGAYRYIRVIFDDRTGPKLSLPEEAFVFIAPMGNPLPPAGTPIEFTRRPGEPGISRFHLRLPGRHLPISAFILDVQGERLMREARVQQTVLGEGEPAPEVLGASTLRKIVKDDISLFELRIPVARPSEPELELSVDDGDNPPIDLTAVSAELSPLPWIYFESPDGSPITAIVGDSRLNEPRYDLEALRAQVDRSKIAEATWGPVHKNVRPLVNEVSPIDPGPGGSLDRTPFTYQREVPKITKGPAALVVDAEVLSQSHTLTDLRIVDPEGRQIQYIMETRDEPLSIPLPVKKDKTENGVSTYRATLPFANLQDIRLVLETSTRVFERKVTIKEEETPKNTPENQRLGRRYQAPAPRLFAEVEWRSVNPDEDALPLVIALGDVEEKTLLILIDEGDNQPLSIRKAKLLLPKYRLRFFHPGSTLTLLYGNSKVSKPRYDAALLAPRLRGFEAVEISPLPSRPVPKVVPFESKSEANNMKTVFWIVLVLSIIVLLFLLARLLKPNSPPSS
jgi:hypothetical protein